MLGSRLILERPNILVFQVLLLLYFGSRHIFSFALRKDGRLAHTADSGDVRMVYNWSAHLVPCSLEEAGFRKPISVQSKAVVHRWIQGMRNQNLDYLLLPPFLFSFPVCDVGTVQ